jgi:hypothetical protein
MKGALIMKMLQATPALPWGVREFDITDPDNNLIGGEQ